MDMNMDMLVEPQANMPSYHSTESQRLEEFASNVYMSLMSIQEMSYFTLVGSEPEHLKDEEQFKPFTKYPRLVRLIRVHLVISPQNFNAVCSPFIGLRILEVGLQQMEHLSNPLAWLNFPVLQVLKVGSPDLDSVKHPLLPESTLTYLVNFLQRVEFPKLASFAVQSPYLLNWERIWVDAFLHFLEKHKKTLRDLILYIKPCPEPNNDKKTDNKSTVAAFAWPCVPFFTDRLQSLELDLKNYFVYISRSVADKELNALLEWIGRTQTFLQTYMTLSPNHTWLDRKANYFQNNAATLVKLTLSVNPKERLNCMALSSCHSLQSLVLAGRPKTKAHYETEKFEGKSAKAELINTKSIPNTLRFLQIVNLFVETVQISEMAELLPRLEILNLLGIGEKENLGITLQLFVQLLLRPEIEEVGVYRGFNKDRVELDAAPGPNSMLFATMTLLGAAKVPFSFYSIAGFSGRGFAQEDVNRFYLNQCPRFILRDELQTNRNVNLEENYDFSLNFENGEHENYKIFSDSEEA